MKAIDERIDDLAAQPEVLLAYLAGQTNQPLNYDGSKFWVIRKGDEVTIRTITGNTKRTIHIESKKDNSMPIEKEQATIELSRKSIYEIIFTHQRVVSEAFVGDQVDVKLDDGEYLVCRGEGNLWTVHKGENELFVFSTDNSLFSINDNDIYQFRYVKLTGEWPDADIIKGHSSEIDSNAFEESTKEGFAQDINSEEPVKEEQVKEEVEAPFTPAEEPKAKWGLGKKVLVGAAVVGTVAAVGYGAWKLANKVTEQFI